MQTIKKVWNWLVVSSANPENISLTVKGFLLGLIPAVLFFLNISKIQIGSTELTNLVDVIGSVVQALLTVVSGLVLVYGFLRKVYLTISGQNLVE